MTRLRDSIKNAERAAWPEVKATLAEQTTPVVIEKLARSSQVRSNVRFVVEQTIEQIARAGLLRTPADADVIGKAVNWRESFGGEPDDQFFDGEDHELYDAVGKLLDELGDRPDGH